MKKIRLLTLSFFTFISVFLAVLFDYQSTQFVWCLIIFTALLHAILLAIIYRKDANASEAYDCMKKTIADARQLRSSEGYWLYRFVTREQMLGKNFEPAFDAKDFLESPMTWVTAGVIAFILFLIPIEFSTSSPLLAFVGNALIQYVLFLVSFLGFSLFISKEKNDGA